MLVYKADSNFVLSSSEINFIVPCHDFYNDYHTFQTNVVDNDTDGVVVNSTVDLAPEGVIMQVATVHPTSEGACQLSLMVGTTPVYFDDDNLPHYKHNQTPIDTPSNESIVVSSNDECHYCNSMQFMYEL